MGSRWRAALASFIFDTTIWFSIAFGILPFSYNTKSRKISASKYALFYSICMNAFMIVVSIFAWPDEDTLDLDAAYEHNLMKMLTSAVLMANIYTLIVIFVKNWGEYKTVLNNINELDAINRVCFAKYIGLAQKCSNYDDYIIWKGLATLLQNLSFTYVIFANADGINWEVMMLLFVVLLLANVIFLVMFHFYLFALTTYRSMWLLQQRLKCIANYVHQYPQNITGATNEVYEIISIYLRLVKLCERSGRVYGHQMLIGTVSIMCSNIQTLFYLRIIWSEKLAELSFWDFFYTLQAVVINVFDFWLTIDVCELALGAAREIAQELRRFNSIGKLKSELNRPLEILAGVCSSHIPEFRLCGLVDLNHVNGCKALLTMILYLIYLVQFSYKDF